MTKPIFSTKNKKIKVHREDIQVRLYVDNKTWLAFKAIVTMKNSTVHSVINDLIKKWIDNSMLNIKYYCNNCKKKVDPKNSFVVVEDGIYFYYCSVDCYSNISI